jgi:hypothetical protein
MAIDEPKDIFKRDYLDEKPSLPGTLAKAAARLGALAIPGGPLAEEVLGNLADSFDGITTKERFVALYNLLVEEIGHLEATKADKADALEAARLVFVYDWQRRNDAKRERFVKLIGNALRSAEQIQDIATFVQTLEQLNERDLTVLKVINKIMNQEGDWKPQPNPGIGNVMKLHPSGLIGRAQELAVQIAMALGQKTETNQFTREVGYMVCLRLQGFGLANEIQSSPRELPLTNYSFQLSVQGVRLLKLLGEVVPNFANYIKG